MNTYLEMRTSSLLYLRRRAVRFSSTFSQNFCPPLVSRRTWRWDSKYKKSGGSIGAVTITYQHRNSSKHWEGDLDIGIRYNADQSLTELDDIEGALTISVDDLAVFGLDRDPDTIGDLYGNIRNVPNTPAFLQ